MQILQQNEKYRIILERHGSENWVEVHTRKTGMSQILKHKNGSGCTMPKLRKHYGEELTIGEIKSLFDRCGCDEVKIYKEGI